MSLLETRALLVRFGGLVAVNAVSLAVAPGEILGLIGPNGAGKTTFLAAISGAVRATGAVLFDGAPILGLPPHRIARRGMSRSQQIVQPFPQMTAGDNVAAGALFSGAAPDLRAARAAAAAVLARVGLAGAADRPAAALTLAQRKRLELAKELAARPKLLLLDEVNAGLNPIEVEQALRLIRSIADEGVAIILVEHLMRVVAGLSDRVAVLHHGALIAEGPPAAVLADPAVGEAYLGRRYAARARA